MTKQITDSILMVRPANFGYNIETAANNAFQSNDTELSPDMINLRAQVEFDHMVSGLRKRGIHVIVVDDTEEPLKSDAVFPNNWFSTHSDGSLYLFPMFSHNRRKEVRQDILDMLASRYGYVVNKDYLVNTSHNQFLESTGSMILDRENKIIYACYSERTSKDLLEDFGTKVGYQVVGFHAEDSKGTPVYHTNVIMTLAEHIAIICTESIVDQSEKNDVFQSLEATGKKIVNITQQQVLSFAGNMLQVKSRSGISYFVMSTSAFKSLTKSQKQMIENHNMILHFDLSTIEKFGGGSARCMMAEIFEPEVKNSGILPLNREAVRTYP